MAITMDDGFVNSRNVSVVSVCGFVFHDDAHVAAHVVFHDDAHVVCLSTSLTPSQPLRFSSVVTSSEKPSSG